MRIERQKHVCKKFTLLDILDEKSLDVLRKFGQINRDYQGNYIFRSYDNNNSNHRKVVYR